MSPDEAFRRIKRNRRDSDALATFYLHMREHLLAYVSGLLLTFRVGGGEQAADVVHDALLAFLERWPDSIGVVPSLQAAEAYMRRSCRNLLVDRYRRDKTAQSFLNFVSVRFSQAFDGEQEVYRKLFVEKIISLVPGPCAELLRIYVEEDVTPAELADRGGQPTATFYSRWYRCIAKIKSLLDAEKGGAKPL